MTKIKKPEKRLDFNPRKCEQIYEELVKVFQKKKPTVAEILVALSNLTYTLGASIEGYKGSGPGLEDLQKIYYSEPGKVGIAMMLQGFTMATWYDDYKQQVLENIKEKTTNNEQK